MIPAAFPENSIPNPALEGLARVGMTGREIAGMAEVTAPTISKWRQGKSRTPAATMVFLTLVLAHKVEEFETYEREYGYGHRGGALSDWLAGLLGQLDAARHFLKAQEACNAAISPESIYEGARRYRDWLERTNGRAGGADSILDANRDGNAPGDGAAAMAPA